MFGKKNTKTSKESGESLHADVQVIPDAFYGGADPQIYHRTTSSKKEQPTGVRSESTVSAPASSKEKKTISAPKEKQSLSPKKKKLILFIGGGCAFVLAVAAITWYYVQDARQGVAPPAPPVNTVTAPPSPTPPAPPGEPIPEPASTVTSTTSTEQTPTTTPPLPLPSTLSFPFLIFTDAVDIDGDELTDQEEEIFQTDAGTWDTDGDGYYDGLEVVHLYNPSGTAPQRIIDSGLVQEYVHPRYGYRLYYPRNWEAGNVDPASEEVIFSAITGDYISVHRVQKERNESFSDWFRRAAQGQQLTQVASFSNRFDIAGRKRQDNLVGYFEETDAVYVIIYHPGTQGAISFRRVMAVVLQSFRPSRVSTDIPEQVPAPDFPTDGTEPSDDAASATSTPSTESSDSAQAQDAIGDAENPDVSGTTSGL